MKPPALLEAPPLCALQPMEPCGPAGAFSHPAWSFELALDGHRALLQFGGGSAPLLHSRGHVDIAPWFPEVAGRPWPVDAGRTVLDGEVCMLDACGRSNPARLHRRALQRGMPACTADHAVFRVRDLLVLDSADLRPLPWSQRRALLRTLGGLDREGLQVSKPVDGRGEWLCRQAAALGYRELLAFRRDAPYRGGLSGACLRIACAVA
jgi:bifunctional non-homologous end joining protein LigD